MIDCSRLAVIGLCAAAPVCAQTVRYRITEISPPNAKLFAGPAEVDNRGRIVGLTTDGPPGTELAYLRDQRGHFTDLELLPGTTFNAFNRLAVGGAVAGLSGTSASDARAAIWDQHGSVTDVGVLPGATFGLANDVNWRGHVIGTSGSDNFVDSRAFIWKRGIMREVPVPGFQYASFEAFGPRGSIVGIGWNVPVPFTDVEGFVMDRRGNVDRIGHLPGGSTSALFDVNGWGMAVGFADDGGSQLAIRYWRGQLTTISPVEGDLFAQLSRINNFGTAVGQSGSPFGPPRGVISRPGEDLVDLNTRLEPGMPHYVFAANGINDWGQITAGAVGASGLPVTVLLTPYVDWADK